MPATSAEINFLFPALTAKTQQAIAERAFTRDLPACFSLLIEGLPAEFCYFILVGEARALRINKDGRVQVLARFSSCDPINIISLLTEEKTNRATIETLSPTSVLVLSATDFDHLVAHCADFSAYLLRLMAARFSKISDLAADLSLYAVRARLARFLIELADLTPSPAGWTQDEIAAHIGTVRDVVGRLLRDFESAGLIQRERGQIILLDRAQLLKTAQE